MILGEDLFLILFTNFKINEKTYISTLQYTLQKSTLF